MRINLKLIYQRGLEVFDRLSLRIQASQINATLILNPARAKIIPASIIAAPIILVPGVSYSSNATLECGNKHLTEMVLEEIDPWENESKTELAKTLWQAFDQTVDATFEKNSDVLKIQKRIPELLTNYSKIVSECEPSPKSKPPYCDILSRGNGIRVIGILELLSGADPTLRDNPNFEEIMNNPQKWQETSALRSLSLTQMPAILKEWKELQSQLDAINKKLNEDLGDRLDKEKARPQIQNIRTLALDEKVKRMSCIADIKFSSNVLKKIYTGQLKYVVSINSEKAYYIEELNY